MRQLEYGQFYTQVFLWILAKIVEEFGALACESRNVVSGLVYAVVKRLVSDQTADSSFAGLGVGEDRLQTSCC